MKLNNIIIHFCQKIHNYKIPKLKFKELELRYKKLYENEFKVYENDVNKANFITFLLFFIIFLISSIFLTRFSLLVSLSFSILLALIITYFFSENLLKQITKKENQLNAFLYIIKIYFSLIQKSHGDKADHAINFIKLISEYRLPISKEFRKMLNKIQLGENPETLLSKVNTPSLDFNLYIKELLISNFSSNYRLNENSLKKKFQKYLREIESKLSILFFFGLFFPLGLSFLILFRTINYFALIPILPLFFISLRKLNKKFLKNNFFLLSLINNYSKEEKARFNEFISFLLSLTLHLKKNGSPELAFVKAYSQSESYYSILERPLKTQISQLLNLSCTFDEILEKLQIELRSVRYKIILEVVGKLVAQNAYLSHEKITEILNELSNHQKLENRLEIIIKGERFKVLLFLFLLPIIIGGIGGIFPFFNLMMRSITLNSELSFSFLFDIVFTHEFIIIFFSLLFCVNVSSHNFLEIVSYERKIILIVASNVIFILAFFSSLINILNYL